MCRHSTEAATFAVSGRTGLPFGVVATVLDAVDAITREEADGVQADA